jgi:phosphate/sulfate permease
LFGPPALQLRLIEQPRSPFRRKRSLTKPPRPATGASWGKRSMDVLLITVVAVVALALLFDFTNGFHDAANSVATVVATRALPARWAPWFSAFFNFSVYFVVGTAVANTVAKVVHARNESIALVFSAFIAAIAWNYATWYIGMPSSSSHAIIGGLVGAGLATAGLAAINWKAVSEAGGIAYAMTHTITAEDVEAEIPR